MAWLSQTLSKEKWNNAEIWFKRFFSDRINDGIGKTAFNLILILNYLHATFGIPPPPLPIPKMAWISI
jgi:hypothetical protein